MTCTAIKEIHQGNSIPAPGRYLARRCVFAMKGDGTLSAYLGKFSTQSLNTDNNGLPI